MHGQWKMDVDLLQFVNEGSRGGLAILGAQAAPNQYKEEKESLPQETKILRPLLDKCRVLVESRVAIYLSLRIEITMPKISEGRAITFVCQEEDTGYLSDLIEFCGFAGIEDFFSLSPVWRAKFLDNARTFVESIFGPNLKGLETLCDRVLEPTRTNVAARLRELKAEDVEREVRAGFAGMATEIREEARVAENIRNAG